MNLSSDQWKTLQTQLKKLGLYSGAIDGLPGFQTYEGLRKALQKLPVDTATIQPVHPDGKFVDLALALELISHEAIIRQAYKDSVDKWTWSVGLTSATGHDVTRYIDKPQSMQKCMDVFVWALKKYTKQVDEVFKDTPLTHEQYAAAVSFHWNTGRIKLASWPKQFKYGDMKAAKANFLSYNRSGGKEDPGLVNRRKKEVDLFFDGIWSNKGLSAEYTQVTTSHYPKWSSRIVVDVSKELALSFESDQQPVMDFIPKPDIVPISFTLSERLQNGL